MRGPRLRRSHKVGLAGALFAAVALLFSQFHGKKVEGEVVAVLDGDTIEVMREGKAQRVRLYGVDCPEKRQPYGRAAKQFTSSLCFGKVVSVRVVDKDRYGRLVGDVTLPDGRGLNRELVRAGLAWWYRAYSKDSTLKDLEDEARSARRGLWADKNPTPPWEYRERLREGGHD